MEWFAQALGIVGMVINILAVQCRRPRGLFVCRMVSSLLFAANLLLLGSPTGALINLVNILRSILLLREKTFRKSSMYISMGLYILAGLVTMEYSLTLMTVLSVLITAAQCADTAAMFSGDFRKIRLCQMLVLSPVWLVHNIAVLTIGGILTESFTILSALIALYRFRKKKPSTPAE